MNAEKVKPPKDFDENPEWTDEMFAKAKPAAEFFVEKYGNDEGTEILAAATGRRGRPRRIDPKIRLNVRLDPDLLRRLRSLGGSINRRIETAVQEMLDKTKD